MEDFVLKRRTFSIFNIALRNILAVKSSKHRSKLEEFYFVGFVWAAVTTKNTRISNRSSNTKMV